MHSAVRRFDLCLAAVLFVSFFILYSASVPASFNRRYENRRFFDSDGEFITRQFYQNRTFTHNDHLLYHLIAKGLYRISAAPPPKPYDSVPEHRWLSISAGAIGVALLFLFGKRVSRSTTGALAAALFIAICAGWWYFSATIDTYIPHLVAAIAALFCALLALEEQRPIHYAWLGAFMGIAFLLRSDGFLLAVLIVVAFADGWKDSTKRIAAWAVTGTIVGVIGYSLLAHAFYNVGWKQIPRWAISNTNRPGIAQHHWGSMDNIRKDSILLALSNQGIYTVVLPGLEKTRSANVVEAFKQSPAKVSVFLLYITLLILAIARLIYRRRWWWLALALLWFIPRTLFYAWWDPSEPFLFACLSLPALWLVLLDFGASPKDADEQKPDLRAWSQFAVVIIAVVTIGLHNYYTMIVPLRQSEKIVTQKDASQLPR